MAPKTSKRIIGGIGRIVLRHAHAFRHESFRNVPTVLLAVAYAAGVSCIADIRPSTIASSFLLNLKELCSYALVTAFVFRLATCIFVTKPRSPLRYFTGTAISALGNGTLGRWLARLWPFALLAAAFALFKPSILRHSEGFVWDAALAEIGRTVHFGYMPWQLLQSWLGYPWITRLLDLNYALWFLVMWVFLIGTVFFGRDEVHRQRAMISFVLLWIVIGTCLAGLFPSAGPCYYDKVVAGPNPYAELMAYLHRTHDAIGLIAVDAQAMLWNDYASGQMNFGISAMPSMHNAVAALMLFACWRFNFWLRLFLSAHALLVFFGSILLGWHYGMDAYVAWAAALVVWAAAEPVAKWWTFGLEHRRRSKRLAPQPT